MKITEITSFGCVAHSSNFIFVRIDADEGISGVGEATLESKELSVLSAIEKRSRALIGKDLRDIELTWVTMNRLAPWKGAAHFSAMNGLEHAMWDVAGKAASLPVYRLLGGPVGNIRAYTFAACMPNFLVSESVHTRNDVAHRIVKEPLRVVDGATRAAAIGHQSCRVTGDASKRRAGASGRWSDRAWSEETETRADP